MISTGLKGLSLSLTTFTDKITISPHLIFALDLKWGNIEDGGEEVGFHDVRHDDVSIV